jgi:hypothetical protein
MAELEIHHAHEHATDDFGKRVGVGVAVIGIVLSVVTIASHRAHTAAVVLKTEANDQWAYFQAKKIRENQAEVGIALVKALGTDASRSAEAIASLAASRDKYLRDAGELQKSAEGREAETHRTERRALGFDLGEGFLELGLVLSSLYFLSKKRFFPVLGMAAALAGAAIAGWSSFL